MASFPPGSWIPETNRRECNRSSREAKPRMRPEPTKAVMPQGKGDEKAPPRAAERCLCRLAAV